MLSLKPMSESQKQAPARRPVISVADDRSAMQSAIVFAETVNEATELEIMDAVKALRESVATAPINVIPFRLPEENSLSGK